MTRLFHVADVHFGREDKAAVDWFTGCVHAVRPDAVLITGDLTMQARVKEFAAAQAWMGALGVPLSVEVGNHDLPYFNPWTRLFRPYARFDRIQSALERPLDLADVVVIPLRTTARAQWRLNWAHGNVTSARLATAIAALNAVRAGRIKVIACHHPLYDGPGGVAKGRTKNGRAALFALAEAGVDLVLSGHVHDPFDIIWTDGVRPVRMVGAGTLSERTRATRPSFNVIEIEEGAIRVTPQSMAT